MLWVTVKVNIFRNNIINLKKNDFKMIFYLKNTPEKVKM